MRVVVRLAGVAAAAAILCQAERAWATATPTPPAGQGPAVTPVPIYRSYAGYEIAVPLAAVDTAGPPVHCSANELPSGAVVDGQGVFRWTPTDEQLGPVYVPFQCAGATTPEPAQGQLILKIAPLDSCALPSCDPAVGCTSSVPPLFPSCCTSGPAVRVAEPLAGCPEGRVLFIGQNQDADTFGRMQNCDVMRVRNFEQSGAEVQFGVEARCVNLLNRVRIRARMESNADFHPLLFDIESRFFFLEEEENGFARRRGLRVSVVGGAPYFDLEGAEANLFVVLTDSDGASVSEQLRVRLSFTPRPDLPDVDATPIATRTAVSTATTTSSPSPVPTSTDLPIPTSTGTPGTTELPTPTVMPTASASPTFPSTTTASASATQTAIETPTASSTRAASETPSQVVKVTSTATAPPTAAPTSIACIGDCNGSGSVTVDEIIAGVRIALGSQALEACIALDPNADNAVEVFELVAAVNNALTGCRDT